MVETLQATNKYVYLAYVIYQLLDKPYHDKTPFDNKREDTSIPNVGVYESGVN